MKPPLILFILLISAWNVKAEETKIDNDILFQGVTRQSTDYSCGAAALATLVTGLVENSRLSEKDVIDEITKLSRQRESKGYTLIDLMDVSKKLGHYAEWRKVPVNQLPKIKIPVILLIGLNSKFPHFVVLKGIENDLAFLADSIRGNIRIPYAKLVEEGVTEKYKDWFVMAIEPSVNKPKDSNLYLAADRLYTHFTVEQSSAITLSTLPKANQLFVSYDFSASVGSSQNTLPFDVPYGGKIYKVRLPVDIDSNAYAHSLNVRYGITESTEITAKIAFNDTAKTYEFPTRRGEPDRHQSYFYKQYELGVNRRFLLDDAGRSGIITGVSGSVSEPSSVWGATLQARGYTNTSYAQFILGGAVGKQFSTIQAIDEILPEFVSSGVISANKPFADNYLASLAFKVVNAHDKSTALIKTNPTLTATSGITYVLDKHFQISPSFGYSFNNGENYIFGTSFAYVGSW